MKKFIALLLVFVMGLSLCACGSNNEQMDTDVTAPDSPLYETLQEKMGIDFMKQDVESIYTTEESAAVYLYINKASNIPKLKTSFLLSRYSTKIFCSETDNTRISLGGFLTSEILGI